MSLNVIQTGAIQSLGEASIRLP